MKRLLIVILGLLAFPAFTFAAGSSATVTKYSLSQPLHNQLVIKVACVADDSNGSVPATELSPSTIGGIDGYTYDLAGFYIFEVQVVDGTPAPDAADIAITDALGNDIYSEENVIPTSGTKNGDVTVRAVNSALTLTVTNQGTNDAEFDVYIKLVR